MQNLAAGLALHGKDFGQKAADGRQQQITDHRTLTGNIDPTPPIATAHYRKTAADLQAQQQ
ncbi:hypothetical protein D3C72_2211210 [compost metagenome]